MFRRAFFYLFLVTLVAESGFSQGSSSQSQGPAPTTTIYSKTELVYVPVVVRDKDGKHVRGLTREAFAVEQDGVPQTVSIFEEVSGPRKEPNAISVGDGFVTNVTPEKSDRQLTVIVLDLMNTPIIRQGEAQRAVIRYLGNNARATHPIALFALNSSGLQQIYSFTEDPALLIRALQKFGTQAGGAADNTAENRAEVDRLESVEGSMAAGDAGMTAIYGRLLAAVKRGNTAYQVSTIRGTLASLEQLAGALAGVPGRKSVIWATAGFPFILDDPDSFENRGTELMDDYARVWKLMNSASVAIYPVDVTGLDAVGMAGSGIYGNDQRITGAQVQSAAHGVGMQMTPGMERQDSLRAIASATGGRAFLNRNDLDKAFEEADSDSADYYLLGYYLKKSPKPGWHRLKATVDVPHSSVRARDGFYSGTAVKAGDKSSRREFATAMAGPIDYTSVTFAARAEVDSKKCSGGKCLVIAETVIPPQSLVIDRDDANFVNFDIAVLALAPDEKVGGESSETIRLHLTPQSLQEVMSTGITYRGKVHLAPGTYDLRVAVRDNQTGKIGTVRTNVTVPKF
jgi:VWFA-related protein